ncbi:uncharacterized protein [Watersipora subatra]|uniref:uncharacterized protein n=1 Tax=Watersipora subatra TaxID=2589382 RepID=UPI00355B9859
MSEDSEEVAADIHIEADEAAENMAAREEDISKGENLESLTLEEPSASITDGTVEPMKSIATDSIEPVEPITVDAMEPIRSVTMDSMELIEPNTADALEPIGSITTDSMEPIEPIMAEATEPIETTVADSAEPMHNEITGAERNSTFLKAESHFTEGRLDTALDYYLKCIKGIEQGSGFLYLPQCLHKIAECYHRKDEDEKAIQFLKAEKIYYETALIDSRQMQEKIDDLTTGDADVEVVRADEYERLAKLCLDKHQCQLALEFSGKATKLYQKNYGDEDASTQRCLDLFTSVYAQVGKEEYTDKLAQYESEPLEPELAEIGSSSEAKTTVHRRRISAKTDTLATQSTVPQDNTSSSPQVVPDGVEKEMSCCCLGILWITLVVCSILAIILFSVVYCKMTPTSWTCHWVRVQYRSFAEQIGFIAYKLSKKGH